MSEGALTASHPAPRQPLLRLLNDARLANLAAEGSTAAFSAIYERHHQELYRYCRSIVRDEHDARDALQNTMIKALRGLEGETREIALRPWLFRIAHNESISLLRKRPTDASIDTASELVATDADPETRQRLRNLIADLELLAPRQRSALVMRELSGLEFDEIGEALETSPAAAKQAVYEARVALLELEEGRDLSCDDVRQKISAEDRRLLRGRRVRAHLKSCSDCRRFSEITHERSRQLAAIAPPLPVPIAMGILEGILGGGGGGGGIAALLGGGGAGIGAATAAKLGVAGLIVLGAGAVAVERGAGDPMTKPQTPTKEIADHAARADEAVVAHRAAEAHHAGATTGGGHESAGGNSANPHRHGNQNQNSGVASVEEDSTNATPPAVDPSSNSRSSNGNGPASSPPGFGATPPGQGGVPPGLGEPPPGHGGTPPGHAGGDPGNSGAAPGIAGTVDPGHGGTPPGLVEDPITGE